MAKKQNAPVGPMAHSGPKIEKARDMRGALRRLLVYLKPYKNSLIVVFALAFVSVILGLMGPYLLGVAVNEVTGPNGFAGLVKTSLWMLSVYLGAWLAQVIQNRIMASVSQKAMRTLRRDLFEHVQTLSLSYFDRHPHGELMSRLTNDMDVVSRVLAQNATILFTSVLTVIGVVIMMFALNFWLALASFLVLPLMVVAAGLVGKRTRNNFRQLQQEVGTLNGQLEEMYSGQRVIMAFGQESATLDKFDKSNEAVRKTGMRAMAYALLIPPMMGILANANIAVVAGVGGWMTIRGLATVGTIASFISYSHNFAGPLRQLGDLYNQIQSALAGAERIFEIIDQKPELTDVADALPLEKISGEVVFDDVSFSYVADTPVIKGMSLHAKPGQTVALVGPTGAGKTTIINLLSRFYDVDSGKIKIDGQDIRGVKSNDLRRKLGVVLQDTFLFTESVMENIRYGRLEATDDEVIAAAKLADADHFIRRLPQGYDTVLSERAGNLSQGQRQLLAIARAVLANPNILILDEATSSVDTRTEVHIQQALLRLMEGRTSFVIAHRLSTIRDADQVLVIDDGRIIESGTHTELLDQRGFYHNLYMSQFKGKVAVAA